MTFQTVVKDRISEIFMDASFRDDDAGSPKIVASDGNITLLHTGRLKGYEFEIKNILRRAPKLVQDVKIPKKFEPNRSNCKSMFEHVLSRETSPSYQDIKIQHLRILAIAVGLKYNYRFY
jgi:hypothetical protein